MLLTEKQAAGLLCPALTATGDTRHCQTSFCMAWRWSGTHAKVYVECNGQPTLIQSDETRQGYCGLAGKPEEL